MKNATSDGINSNYPIVYIELYKNWNAANSESISVLLQYYNLIWLI